MVQGHGAARHSRRAPYYSLFLAHTRRATVSETTEKADLRRKLRARRAALSPEERLRAAHRLAAHVASTRAFRVSRRIAAYIANDGEIDPAPILERAQAMGKRCYLPVLSRLSWDRLWFAPLTADAKFRPNRYGIPEPQMKAAQLVRAPELDLILMPLVGFDPAGNRLGMGGGFYDRSLEFLHQRHRWHKPHLLGLAYDFQRLERLPANNWDIALGGIATDESVYLTPAQ